MSEPVLIEATFMNIYIRTRINETGRRPRPIPVFEMPRLNTKHLDLQIRDLANQKVAMNLIAADIDFYIFDKKYDGNILVHKSVGDGIVKVMPDIGAITITLTPSDLNLQAGTYWYDLVINNSDEISSHTFGKLRLLQ